MEAHEEDLETTGKYETPFRFYEKALLRTYPATVVVNSWQERLLSSGAQ